MREQLMNTTLRYGDPEEAGMCPERVALIRRLCAGWVEQGITTALVVLAARRGVIVLHEAFGRLTPDEDAPPVRLDTIFPLASLAKPITATAVMCLVEDGLLGLNRPVHEYVPEFAGQGKQEVMVHHLLTHTSGQRDEDLNAYVLAKVGAGVIRPPEPLPYGQPDEFAYLRCLDAAYDAPLWRAPGQEMSYCNYGYALLAEIVRRVSGGSLAHLADARIFQPLGMKDTADIVPEPLQDRLVRRPDSAPLAGWLNCRECLEWVAGPGGVYSTAMDMAIFGQMFLNRGRYGDARILSPASTAEMTRDQVPGIGARYGEEVFPEASWGLGWDVHGNKKRAIRDASLHSPQAFGHGGAGGVSLWADPVYEIVGAQFPVVLEDLPNGLPKLCRDHFVNAVTAAITDD
jgi:CubicO group peptidase (beta-lactamase class C family)